MSGYRVANDATGCNKTSVGQTRRILPFVFGLALLLGHARGAVLIHNYALRGSLDDSQGGLALTALGGTITSLGYVFAANQGLVFNSSLFTAADFSLEFSFKFDATAGFDKIVDFHQLTADAGFYQKDGLLNFFPAAEATVSDFAPSTTVHVVLTRDAASNIVAGYVNGEQRFSFVDTGSLAVSPVASGNLSFFVDDLSTGQGEASGGTVASIRIFNGALSATEVSTIFAAGRPPLAIPEPSTAALLAVGAVVVCLTVVRRRKAR